jgi:methylated-DNA-protein-cysteine methyltransferase-like protein
MAKAATRAAVTSFTRRVLSVVRAIPPGRVATYGDVARLAGAPRAARAVGNILRECDDPSLPAHRVTGADGRLGGYGSSPHLKRQLLAAEGVTVRGSRLRDFSQIRWTGGGRASARRGSRGTRATLSEKVSV